MEVLDLVVKLILDESIKAHIDGTAGFLEVQDESSSSDQQFEQSAGGRGSGSETESANAQDVALLRARGKKDQTV